MKCQSCLSDPQIRVVADASITINLNATGVSREILQALPTRLLVVEEVVAELKEGEHTGRSDAAALSEWVKSGDIEIVSLGRGGLKHFESLVSGSAADTLDDGEAATIAYALEMNAIPVIDERKANRLCHARFSAFPIACSLDILGHSNVIAKLGHTRLAEAIFNALQNGRMRVPPQHLEWVVATIGEERAATCHSLPRQVRMTKAQRTLQN